MLLNSVHGGKGSPRAVLRGGASESSCPACRCNHTHENIPRMRNTLKHTILRRSNDNCLYIDHSFPLCPHNECADSTCASVTFRKCGTAASSPACAPSPTSAVHPLCPSSARCRRSTPWYRPRSSSTLFFGAKNTNILVILHFFFFLLFF